MTTTAHLPRITTGYDHLTRLSRSGRPIEVTDDSRRHELLVRIAVEDGGAADSDGTTIVQLAKPKMGRFLYLAQLTYWETLDQADAWADIVHSMLQGTLSEGQERILYRLKTDTWMTSMDVLHMLAHVINDARPIKSTEEILFSGMVARKTERDGAKLLLTPFRGGWIWSVSYQGDTIGQGTVDDGDEAEARAWAVTVTLTSGPVHTELAARRLYALRNSTH